MTVYHAPRVPTPKRSRRRPSANAAANNQLGRSRAGVDGVADEQQVRRWTWIAADARSLTRNE
jgi:hypothetical protein